MDRSPSMVPFQMNLTFSFIVHFLVRRIAELQSCIAGLRLVTPDVSSPAG